MLWEKILINVNSESGWSVVKLKSSAGCGTLNNCLEFVLNCWISKRVFYIPFTEHSRNFQKYPRDLGSSFGKPYDYDSVMHYSRFAFSKDLDVPTIIPADGEASIGQRLGLSYYDREEINTLYRCHGEWVYS